MKSNKFILILSILVLAGLYRLLPHLNNVTPIGAMALAGGLYLKRKGLMFIIPIAVLYLSDFILNNTIHRAFIPQESGLILWSNYMTYVYGAFALIVVIGLLLKNSSTASKIIGGTLFSSLLFFFLTNGGSWLTGTLYPKTITGLFSALMAGIPFFKGTLLGNIIFIPMFVLFFDKVLKIDSVPTQNTMEPILDRGISS